MDGYASPTTQLSSTGTGLTAGDTITYTVFGHDCRAWRNAGGGSTKTGLVETSLNPSGTLVYGYALVFGASAFGMLTDASSVRASHINIFG
jgi:hypothetical protein